MSDLMLHAVLEMPPELWTGDLLGVAQRHSRYLQASERIKADADEITALKSQLEAATQWISCADELPKDAKPVIVHGGCGHYSHKYKQWFTNMEVDNFGEYRPIQWEVTEWMPIPPPSYK